MKVVSGYSFFLKGRIDPVFFKDRIRIQYFLEGRIRIRIWYFSKVGSGFFLRSGPDPIFSRMSDPVFFEDRIRIRKPGKKDWLQIDRKFDDSVDLESMSRNVDQSFLIRVSPNYMGSRLRAATI